jgi:ATP-dependent helicase/nuclease subunit A
MNADARIAETTEQQRIAADPSLSAFVSANAGSGKTRVLTNRVARLLLNNVSPSSILCITFTKAAAAEMADRLFKLLGGWALADDMTLTKGLNDLGGEEGRMRSPAELSRARRLFAQALETPGGLKIQTIHSFCESVLKRFPLEAGVPPGFSVIDAPEAKRLAHSAVDAIALRSKKDESLHAAFTHLLSRINGGDLRALLEDAVASRRREFMHAETVGWTRLIAEAACVLGADRSVEDLHREIATLRPRAAFERILKACNACGGDPQKYGAAPLEKFLSASDDETRVMALTTFFLTDKLAPRKNLATAKLDAVDPGVRGFFAQAQQEFTALHNALGAAHACADTKAFYVAVEAASDAYAAAKQARAALDFDDLIAFTLKLLTGKNAADWVLYKLDQGLDHILLDEAQDTGPDAWDVIERPLDEFLAGAGARVVARTFFAVGDKKQSIYSFQGADAKLFDGKSIDLGEKIAAAGPFRNVPLKASFRTTAPVLEFVDRLFARQSVYEGVSDIQPEHHCTREGAAGRVEVWPLAPYKKAEAAKAWDAPFDQNSAANPKRTLAETVAKTIADWLDSGELLESQGRPIAAGDIMILVQKRSALFHEMIRALSRRGVPVAGADKLKLVEDQGVLDLLSYARAALYEGDDLSLAEILKSPFFNIGEDVLFDLAHGREGSLWTALAQRQAERPDWLFAAREIALARAVALKDGPVAFFMHVLETGAPSGWRRIAARLGAPAREPLEEFLRLALDFEASNPRSLRLFLDAVSASDAEANRESAEAGASVRVMTAHKSKGLEAPIVFILDAHAPPKAGGKEVFQIAEGPKGARVPLLAVGEGKLAPALVAATERKKAAAWDEYRRLLYVAATRAEDRLYVCGHQLGNRGYPENSDPERRTWHALALDAMGPETETSEELFGGKVRRLSSPQTTAPKLKRHHGGASITPDAPAAFFFAPAPAEKRQRRLSPSMLAPETDDAYRPGRGEAAFLRGRILHRLLEMLPGLEPARRPEAALRLARRMGAEEPDALAAEAMRVIEDPQFAPVFAPGGLSEVAIGGAPKGARAGLTLSGQIDRLAIDGRRVLVVDYKTNRPPPQQLEDVAPGYIAQLAAYRALLQEIYPAHKIEAALLWTYDARLMPIPAEALDRAFTMTLA